MKRQLSTVAATIAAGLLAAGQAMAVEQAVDDPGTAGLGGSFAAYAAGERPDGYWPGAAGDTVFAGAAQFDLAPPGAESLGIAQDAARLSYFTPRLAGFQLGMAPSDGEEARGLGVNYLGTLSNVTVRLFGGYGQPDAEPAGTAVPEEWSFGGQVAWGGFTVAAGYRGLTGLAEPDREDWNVGLSYGAGPWDVGVQYTRSEQDPALAGEEEALGALGIGGSYSLGPGVLLSGGVQWWALDSEERAAAREKDNDAWFAFIGTNIRF